MPGTFRPRHLPDPKRDYEQARGSARQRGYTSKWDKASKRFLRDNPVCPACAAAGFLEVSQVTDHIIPHRGDRCLFWDQSNWQPCCRWHHDVVKQQLERMFQLNQVKAADLLLTSAIAMDLAARLRV